MPRKYQRHTHFVEILMESASGRREARLSEVSLGGCFIESIGENHPGETVSFEIKDHDPPVRFTGVIVYTFPGIGFGVRFTDLSQSGLEYLKSLFGQTDASWRDTGHNP
jgi:hypothetical protein